MGIKQVVDSAGNDHVGDTEAALRRVRRLWVNRENLRRAVTRLVNATLATRDTGWWGEGTACASDSKKFGSWSSNFMTEYHVRYGGPGVMIYWHVERRSVSGRKVPRNLTVPSATAKPRRLPSRRRCLTSSRSVSSKKK
jgi:hypothetical protein